MIVDETLLPGRRRLVFRQFIFNNAHRYGVKFFKFCSVDGYTWAIKVYREKSATGEREVGLAEKVCLELAQKLFREGRTLHVDNFYIMYELALSLLVNKTHLVGTLRANRKDIPKDVLEEELKREALISRKDKNSAVVLKWKDT